MRNTNSDLLKVMKINNKKNNLLNFLTEVEKEQFLDELLTLIFHHKIEKQFESIEQCLDSWEDVAELNCIPNLKANVWERFNSLKRAGKVS